MNDYPAQTLLLCRIVKEWQQNDKGIRTELKLPEYVDSERLELLIERKHAFVQQSDPGN